MFDIKLFLNTPTFNIEDFDIFDEILTAMLDVETLEIPSFDI
jgi:hypothetical protein